MEQQHGDAELRRIAEDEPAIADLLSGPDSDRLRRCACYVRELDAEARFSLRYGAHSQDCPTYRASQDPVDRRADEAFRAEHEPEPGAECPPGHYVGCPHDL